MTGTRLFSHVRRRGWDGGELVLMACWEKDRVCASTDEVCCCDDVWDHDAEKGGKEGMGGRVGR